ncbi:MAG TPA: alpha/beta fold hydrolase, partial [Fluviicoccus sp.]|nr:alpha/beta fold hydrolase [Fluviicoccus sp.]
ERALVAAGHPVCNVGYPSRQENIQQLAQDHVLPKIRACLPGYAGPVHFVTHSMGGLVVRQLAQQQALQIGRVVMLAPPNRGSEIVDRLGDNALFRRVGGPAAQQLRSRADDPAPPSFQLGVLAGDRTLNPWLSLLLPGANDGKVTVASTRLPGMQDFRVLHTSHPLILHNRTAIDMTVNFIEFGCFAKADSPRSRLHDSIPAARPGVSRDGTLPQGCTSA